jgi:hypothetical protein
MEVVLLKFGFEKGRKEKGTWKMEHGEGKMMKVQIDH